MIEIELKRLPHGEGLPAPTYATDGAAGLDVVAPVGSAAAPPCLLPRAGAVDRDRRRVRPAPRVRHRVRVGEGSVEVDVVEPGALEGADEQPGTDRRGGVRVHHRGLDRRSHLVEHRTGHLVPRPRRERRPAFGQPADQSGSLLPECGDLVGVRVGGYGLRRVSHGTAAKNGAQ